MLSQMSGPVLSPARSTIHNASPLSGQRLRLPEAPANRGNGQTGEKNATRKLRYVAEVIRPAITETNARLLYLALVGQDGDRDVGCLAKASRVASDIMPMTK